MVCASAGGGGCAEDECYGVSGAVEGDGYCAVGGEGGACASLGDLFGVVDGGFDEPGGEGCGGGDVGAGVDV